MGGPEDYPEFDASTRSRILTPSPESLFSNHEASMVESKKRKRENGTVEELFDESFVVKAHPSTMFTKPHTLNPVALISRTNVPLSLLDILSPSGPLPVSRLFEGHVKVLELEERIGNTPAVLIAEAGDRKSIFVLERVEQNLYVICKLGSWVNLSRLCTAAIISRPQPYNVASRYESGALISEDKNELQVPSKPSKYNKKKRLAIEAIQSMVKRPPRDSMSTLQVEALPCSQPAREPESHFITELEPALNQDDINKRPMAAEIFENIRSQYFEALYLSKASLAYFAKGPLSRARAAFHLDYDSTLDMNELMEFLEELILPTAVVDKKYKDGVPQLLLSLMPDGSVEEENKTPQKNKKLKNKKLKPGKNGLYPAEDSYLCQWWGSYDADVDKDASGGSKEDVMKNRVAQLRIREMQLQMIVILETLALKSLATLPIDENGELPSIGRADGRSDGRPGMFSKPKKPLNLALIIEVNIDRLCIWQSLAAEDDRRTSTPEGASNTGPKPSGLGSTHDHAADILREFCVEVIIPFFSARLPEQCGVICRKLGGPIIASPARPTLTPTSSSTASSRPGGAIKRPVLNKARRSLRRVLTDERHAREGSRGALSAISLMRSATASTIPGLKRERSETPLLSNIPSAESQGMLVNRGGVLKSKNFSQREVDLSNLATVNDAKLKKANIEAELKDAISALKKPNRQLAGQLQVDAERRAASALTRSRKSKKPVRNPSFQGVQILSTPKRNRGKYLAIEKPPLHGLDLQLGHEIDVITPSSLHRVPLSVVRASRTWESEKNLLREITPARSGTKINSAFLETPSPTQTKPSPCSLGVLLTAGSQNHGGLHRSPLQATPTGRQQFLTSFSKAVDGSPSKIIAVHATPNKKGKMKLVDEGACSRRSGIIGGGAGVDSAENLGSCDVQRGREDDSIYKSLGWDDFDELT